MKKEDFKLTFCKAEELKENFTQVPNTLWTTKLLSLENKVVLGYLLSHSNNFKANKTFLAAGLGTSRTFIIDSFKRLKKSKVISVATDNTLTFNLKILSVATGNTLNEVLSPTTDSVATDYSKCSHGQQMVSSPTTDSVATDNRNNNSDKKNEQKEEQKEEQKDKQGNDNLLSDVLPKVTHSIFFFGETLQQVQDFHTKVNKELKMKIPIDKFEKILMWLFTNYMNETIVDNTSLNKIVNGYELSYSKAILDKVINEMKTNPTEVEVLTNKLKLSQPPTVKVNQA